MIITDFHEIHGANPNHSKHDPCCIGYLLASDIASDWSKVLNSSTIGSLDIVEFVSTECFFLGKLSSILFNGFDKGISSIYSAWLRVCRHSDISRSIVVGTMS